MAKCQTCGWKLGKSTLKSLIEEIRKHAYEKHHDTYIIYSLNSDESLSKSIYFTIGGMWS